jgi:hypothetical protein
MSKTLVLVTAVLLSACGTDSETKPGAGTWTLTETRGMLCTSSTLDPGVPVSIELLDTDNQAGFDGHAFIYFADGTHGVADWDWMPAVEPAADDPEPQTIPAWVRILNGSYLRGDVWWEMGTGTFSVDETGALATDGFWTVQLKDGLGSCSYGFDGALQKP